MLIAYIGPETVVPLLSVLAGMAGMLLVLGRRAIDPFVKLFRLLRRRTESK